MLQAGDEGGFDREPLRLADPVTDDIDLRLQAGVADGANEGQLRLGVRRVELRVVLQARFLSMLFEPVPAALPDVEDVVVAGVHEDVDVKGPDPLGDLLRQFSVWHGSDYPPLSRGPRSPASVSRPRCWTGAALWG